MNPLDVDHLRQWIGRRDSARDRIDAGRAQALAAAIDREDALADGDALPPLWHWIYFWSPARASGLGEDGHPKRGGFLPPVPLPRRMWAGGRLHFDAPLQLGAPAHRESSIADVKLKQGRTGAMAFVTVEHRIMQGGLGCLREEHDIVYREARPGTPTAPALPAPTGAQWTRSVQPDPVLLFRYSALTFNGHRIHYDRRYATATEGYPGLVVHGPLVATLLLDLLRRHQPSLELRSFSFRAVSPLFDTEPFGLHGKLSADRRSASLWATDARGALAMQAEATLSG